MRRSQACYSSGTTLNSKIMHLLSCETWWNWGEWGEVGREKKFSPWKLHSKNNPKTIQWKDWRWHGFTAENSTFVSCTHSQTVRWKQQSEGKPAVPPASEGSILGHRFLARLYKQIEIHTSEYSGQQVLLLHLRHAPDSQLSLQAIPRQNASAMRG